MSHITKVFSSTSPAILKRLPDGIPPPVDDSFWAIATTEDVDSVGDVVCVDGVDLSNHRPESPIKVLASHLRALPDGSPPILGRAEEFRRAIINGVPALLFRMTWAPSPLAQSYKDLADGGYISTFSIGATILESRPRRGGGREYVKTKLLEISAVTLPANPNATILREPSDPTSGTAASLEKSMPSLENSLADLVRISSITDRSLSDPYLGLFKNSDEFWDTMLKALRPGAQADDGAAHRTIYGPGGYISRLQKSATGQNEAIDADGGVLILPTVAQELIRSAPDLSGFAAEAFNFPMSGLTHEMPALVDKNHNTAVTGGITVARKEEGESPDKSKAAMEKIGFKVTKQSGYTDITAELDEDVPALGAIIGRLFASAFSAADDNDFVFNGSGAGEPLAALHANNPSLITVAKETGQAADTIVTPNIVNMRTRCYDYGNAVWVANQDVIPQLLTLKTENGEAVFKESSDGDTILGRPVRYTEYAAALGDLNDIGLVVPRHYGIGTRQAATGAGSIHVRFLQGENTLKFTRRNDGQPLWKSALTPKNGNTRSPFINLAAR